MELATDQREHQKGLVKLEGLHQITATETQGGKKTEKTIQSSNNL